MQETNKQYAIGDYVTFTVKEEAISVEKRPNFLSEHHGYVVDRGNDIVVYCGSIFYNFNEIEITDVEHSSIYNLIVGNQKQNYEGVLTTNVVYNSTNTELQKAVIESNLSTENKLELIRILENKAQLPDVLPIPGQPQIWYNNIERRLDSTPDYNSNDKVVRC